jgi:hypothetical protein
MVWETSGEQEKPRKRAQSEVLTKQSPDKTEKQAAGQMERVNEVFDH